MPEGYRHEWVTAALLDSGIALKKFIRVGLLVAACVGGVVLLSMAAREFPSLSFIARNLRTCVPTILSVKQRPEALQYRARPVETPVLAIADIPEPSIPLDHSRIQGRVLHAIRDEAFSSWVIQSYVGKYWTDVQHLYAFAESTGSLSEIDEFTNGRHVVASPTLLHTGTPGRAFVAFSVAPQSRFYEDSEYDLWSFELPKGPLRHISNGWGLEASPDRSRAYFLRSDSRGFHVLHLWNVATGEVIQVISMWESDPGSGTSFSIHWTADSKALRIIGDCGGFEASRDSSKWVELDLVYLVGSNEMVTFR
jgi:hypothetical protein